MGTSYIPFSPWALFFCFSFLWYFLLKKQRESEHRLTGKKVFAAAWITQFTLTLIGFHWVAYTAHEFGNMPWFLAIPVLLLFCTFIHLYIPLAALIWWHLQKRKKMSVLASALSLATIHFLLESFWPSIFPWNLGYPWLWAGWPAAQWADTIGFQGLSFITYLINALVVYAYWSVRQERKRRPALIALALGSFLILFLQISGEQKRKHWQSQVSSSPQSLKVLQVQGNIGNLVKVYAEKGRNFRSHIIDTFFKLTEKGLTKNPQTDLIVWPETAFPTVLDQNNLHSQRLRSFIQKVQTPLMTGAYSQKSGKSYNGVFYINANGESPLPPYRKHILLAWGEYIPLGETFPFLYKLIPAASAFGRGVGAQVFPVNLPHRSSKIILAPHICYEGLFPKYIKKFADLGGEVLVNYTNDSWFGPTFEPYQHSVMTLARALEFRRPLIRVTNTGITGAILADGSVLDSSPMGEEWTGALSNSLSLASSSDLLSKVRISNPLDYSVFISYHSIRSFFKEV